MLLVNVVLLIKHEGSIFVGRLGSPLFHYHPLAPPPPHKIAAKPGNSGEIEGFYFQSEKSRGKERYFENSRKIGEILLFHFGEVTFSILSHASSCVLQLPSLLLSYSVLCILWNQKFELRKVVSSPSQTPHLSKEVLGISEGFRGKRVAFHERDQGGSGNFVLK